MAIIILYTLDKEYCDSNDKLTSSNARGIDSRF